MNKSSIQPLGDALVEVVYIINDNDNVILHPSGRTTPTRRLQALKAKGLIVSSCLGPATTWSVAPAKAEEKS